MSGIPPQRPAPQPLRGRHPQEACPREAQGELQGTLQGTLQGKLHGELQGKSRPEPRRSAPRSAPRPDGSCGQAQPAAQAGWPAVERRRGGDRRRRPASPLNLRALLGRRRRLRRAEDRRRADLHLDWYEPHLLAVTLAIVVLCLADAHNTLLLLGAGARELNVLMDQLIRQGTERFVALKLAVTALSLLILVAYHRVALGDRLRVRHALYAVLAGYALLVAYEVFLWPGPVLLFFLFRP